MNLAPSRLVSTRRREAPEPDRTMCCRCNRRKARILVCLRAIPQSSADVPRYRAMPMSGAAVHRGAMKHLRCSMPLEAGRPTRTKARAEVPADAAIESLRGAHDGVIRSRAFCRDRGHRFIDRHCSIDSPEALVLGTLQLNALCT